MLWGIFQFFADRPYAVYCLVNHFYILTMWPPLPPLPSCLQIPVFVFFFAKENPRNRFVSGFNADWMGWLLVLLVTINPQRPKVSAHLSFSKLAASAISAYRQGQYQHIGENVVSAHPYRTLSTKQYTAVPNWLQRCSQIQFWIYKLSNSQIGALSQACPIRTSDVRD